MKHQAEDTTRLLRRSWKTLLFLAGLACFSAPAIAQNTKGDKPVNQGGPLLRFPKFKSRHKGGDRAYTRDISGRRRVRTKNFSSANRVIYSAPNPYAGRKRARDGDKAAQPIGRIYRTTPREGQRAWKGSSSGSRLRVRSSSARLVRNNLYSQHGRYVNNPAKRPRTKTKIYTRTVHGENVSNRQPAGPPRTWLGRAWATASGPFQIRGRKNVYWGKFSKGERPITHDLTGRPLLKRNFHSAGLGIGRSDTLNVARQKSRRQGAYTGSFRSGYMTASRRGERAWSGDVSGHALRKRTAKRGNTGGIYVFGLNRGPSGGDHAQINGLPPRQPGAGASGIRKILRKITGRKPAPGGGSVSKAWNNNKRPIEVRTPGVGAAGIGGFQGTFKQGALFSGFNHEGAGYSGNFKQGRQYKGGGSASGRFFNNRGQALPPRRPGLGAGVGNYRGNIPQGGLYAGFSHAGAGFSGNARLRRQAKGGGSVSGRYLNNNGRPVDVRTPGVGAAGVGRYQGNFKRGDLLTGFSHEGAGFAGNFKVRRSPKGGGSISGKYLNNGGRPIPVRTPGAGGQGMDKFTGNFHRGELFFGFSHEGAGFSGNMKARRTPRGGGSVSGRVWNNHNQPLQVRGGAPGFDEAARYKGNLFRDETFRGFGQQGYGWSGNVKAKRPQKGGGSISEKIFNNNGHPIEVRAPGSETSRASRFSGNFRAKRQEKGGGSISNRPRNNNGQPIDVRAPGSETSRASRFAGNFRAKKQEKGGGSISGQVWNNNGKPIDVHAPGPGQAAASEYSGSMRSSFFKRNYIQSPKSSDESIKKKRPNPNMFDVNGLTVRGRQETYSRKPHANDNALPGIGPKEGAIKASTYSSSMKMTWHYVHNRSSNNHALKVIAPGKAYARINDYQGDMKMRKYNDRHLHPEAQFAHGSRDNTKADRTLMINLKLLWAKFFRKNANQPAIVKEKERKPRYDKKEKELWKALYD